MLSRCLTTDTAWVPHTIPCVSCNTREHHTTQRGYHTPYRAYRATHVSTTQHSVVTTHHSVRIVQHCVDTTHHSVRIREYLTEIRAYDTTQRALDTTQRAYYIPYRSRHTTQRTYHIAQHAYHTIQRAYHIAQHAYHTIQRAYYTTQIVEQWRATIGFDNFLGLPAHTLSSTDFQLHGVTRACVVDPGPTEGLMEVLGRAASRKKLPHIDIHLHVSNDSLAKEMNDTAVDLCDQREVNKRKQPLVEQVPFAYSRLEFECDLV
ncbi:hypothetical protein J6590_016172 [Homalodisca vitripennis]|nr:hypothetical protein J6590_016172 [Homalodisca vitripennis]